MRHTREILPARPRLALVVAAVGGLALAGCTAAEKTAFCPLDDGGTPSRVAGGADKAARPPVVAASLPSDRDASGDVGQGRRTFVKGVLPLALETSRAILADRRFVEAVIACHAAGRPLAPAAQARLDGLSAAYKAEGSLDTLRRRLDVVPTSLMLAQAAIESGWGTSRFAREGNALFGQRTTKADRGMQPQGLDDATPVRVAAFPHLQASVMAYVHNLNTQPAYRAFRERRAALREAGRHPDGLELAATLTAYSERGQAYVGDVKTIIRGNRFHALDAVQAIDAAAIGESDA